ncbi:hypothetical protein LFWB_6650 [Candidatus Phytoplasma luffae]|uniref:Uncharacterized protein n=1 Tax=Loofah witches'-broom phytoplasma TaxID=35773 RepID=A0A975FLK8_LOWBP|nr:hypothetical protein [Candidatus Phytoplasma luffae]QTX03226.1 hypothetical protein LFWB_6650 [Candidatus Phytoplasma luffae]
MDNYKKNIKNKIKKIKLFPFIFNSCEGLPFRTETYNINEEEKKIEFFNLEQSKYNEHFLNMQQYVIWSSLNNCYRVFIDEHYYKEFSSLYQKEINIMYIDFLEKILIKNSEIFKKKIFNLFLLIFLFLPIGVFLLKKNYSSDFCIMSVYLLFLSLFSFLFVSRTKKQQNFLKQYKKLLFEKMITKVKSFLGLEFFEEILKKQKEYPSKVNIKKEE